MKDPWKCYPEFHFTEEVILLQITNYLTQPSPEPMKVKIKELKKSMTHSVLNWRSESQPDAYE